MTENYVPHEAIENRTRWKTPHNLGWLEVDLSKDEVDHLWKCVNDSREKNLDSFKEGLAGNLSQAYLLNDLDDYFYNNTLKGLMKVYKDSFTDMCDLFPMLKEDKLEHEPRLERLWVNYMKKHDFNPVHDHTGIYSFVVWLKVPVDFEDQNKDNITNTPVKSSFQFIYSDILGMSHQFTYYLGKGSEGGMLFFPSQLPHQVYPFYNCEEDRISISGNLIMKRR